MSKFKIIEKKVLMVVIMLSIMAMRVQSQHSLIDDLEGTWQGQGILQGDQTNFHMHWENELNDNFLKLTFSSQRRVDSSATELFQATAMYKPNGENWTGTWYDSRGVILPLNARAEKSRLTVNWGQDDIERGRTVYELINPREIQVEDFVLVKGEYKLFGSVKYRKVDANDGQPRVTGIGGVFFKTSNTESTREWYRKHLGIINGNQGGSFIWRKYSDQESYGFTVWHAFDEKDDYFKGSQKDFMINYRVTNLDGLLKNLKAENVQVIGDVETYPFGRFAWIIDPDGRKIELWEPIDPGFLELFDDKGERIYNLSN